MKTLIIAIEITGNRTTIEVEVPARKWDRTMKEVGQQLQGKTIHTIVVIAGKDVHQYNRDEVAEIFGVRS